MDLLLNLRASEAEDLGFKLRYSSSEKERLEETCRNMESELQEAKLRVNELEVSLNLSSSEKGQLEEKLKERDSQLNGLASTEAEL